MSDRSEALAIDSERVRERTRDLDQRERAIKAREAELNAREDDLDDATIPRVNDKVPAEWNLPTVAATIEEAHAMVQRRRSSASRSQAVPKTALGRVRDVASANPLATFAMGFATASLALILIWVVGQ